MRLNIIITVLMNVAAAVAQALNDSSSDPAGTSTVAMPSSVTTSLVSTQSPHPYTGVLPSKLELHCSGLEMPANYAKEVAIAQALLDKTCQGGSKVIIPIRSAMFWFNDDTQIYYCNYQWTVQETCSVEEYFEASEFIDIACGKEMGGWVYLPEWGESIGRDPTMPDGSRRRECW